MKPMQTFTAMSPHSILVWPDCIGHTLPIKQLGLTGYRSGLWLVIRLSLQSEITRPIRAWCLKLSLMRKRLWRAVSPCGRTASIFPESALLGLTHGLEVIGREHMYLWVKVPNGWSAEAWAMSLLELGLWSVLVPL